MIHRAIILLTGLVLDRVIGDPDWLWRRFPHPVVGFGKAISIADRLFNETTFSDRKRKINGVVAIILLLLLSLMFGDPMGNIINHI